MIPGAPAPAPTRILVDGAARETGEYLATILFKSTGYRFQIATNAGPSAVPQAILLTTNNALGSLGAEGYELTVATDSVVIRAPAAAGLFYGVQTLLQLLPPEIYAPRPVTGVPWTVPCVYIQDWPRFPWRGWMLDSVRHFFNKDEVKELLDAMALHKLNMFHWHLDDDSGWRLEIQKWPLLTQVSAWRTNMMWDLNPRASTALGRRRQLRRLLYAGGGAGNRGIRGPAAHHGRAGDRDAGPFVRGADGVSAIRLRLPDLLQRTLQPERHELCRRRLLRRTPGDDVVPAGRADGGDGAVSRPLHPHWRRRGEFQQLAETFARPGPDQQPGHCGHAAVPGLFHAADRQLDQEPGPHDDRLERDHERRAGDQCGADGLAERHQQPRRADRHQPAIRRHGPQRDSLHQQMGDRRFGAATVCFGPTSRRRSRAMCR